MFISKFGFAKQNDIENHYMWQPELRLIQFLYNFLCMYYPYALSGFTVYELNHVSNNNIIVTYYINA